MSEMTKFRRKRNVARKDDNNYKEDDGKTIVSCRSSRSNLICLPNLQCQVICATTPTLKEIACFNSERYGESIKRRRLHSATLISGEYVQLFLLLPSATALGSAICVSLFFVLGQITVNKPCLTSCCQINSMTISLHFHCVFQLFKHFVQTRGISVSGLPEASLSSPFV